MLRACAALLKPAGRLAFLTIEPAPGISPDDRRRAVEYGPVEVDLDTSHEHLLDAAGFTDIASADVTADFARTQLGWLDQWKRHEPELVELFGQESYDQRVEDRVGMRSAIEEGLLRRTLYAARVPATRRSRLR